MSPVRSHRSGYRLRTVLMEPARGPTEVMTAIYMLAFSLPLFSLSVLAKYPTYAQMARMAPGWVWGSSLCALALLRIWTVMKRSYRWRIGTTAASMFAWMFLCLSFLLAQKWHPGVTVFAWWAIAETWTLFRIQK